MDSRRRSVGIALLGAVVISLVPTGAGADERHRWNGGTDNDGIVVDIGREGYGPGRPGAGGGGPVCTMHPVEAAPPIPLPIEFVDGDPGRPLILYDLYCDGEWVRQVRVDVNAPGGPRIRSPRQIAEEVRTRIPVPHSEVGVNPARGLTGIESWFWVAGSPPVPITQTVTELGVSVTVTAVPSSYQWSFGDGGGTVTTTPGQAYPARSEVRHVYERPSPAGAPFTLSLTFVYAVTFSAMGGPPVALAPITRTVTRPLEVVEMRSRLVPLR